MMRYILDQLPHARNKRKWTADSEDVHMHCTLSEEACPKERHLDELEHSLTCEHPEIGEPKVAFHATLITTLREWHIEQSHAYATYSLTQRYTRTCLVPTEGLSLPDHLSG